MKFEGLFLMIWNDSPVSYNFFFDESKNTVTLAFCLQQIYLSLAWGKSPNLIYQFPVCKAWKTIVT